MDDREQGQLGEVLKIRVQASTFQLRLLGENDMDHCDF